MPYSVSGSRRHAHRVCDIHVSVIGPIKRKEEVIHAFHDVKLELKLAD